VHRNFHKYTWTSPDRKIHIPINYILIDRRWHPSILDVRTFTGSDCDTNHCLVVAEVRERMAINKGEAQNVDVVRFYLRKLRELEVSKQYQFEI